MEKKLKQRKLKEESYEKIKNVGRFSKEVRDMGRELH